MSTNTATEISAEQFTQEVEQYNGKVLIDFYAPWCAPCKMIAPVIEQIANEQTDLKVIKINADNAEALMSQYGVRGLPTLLLADEGKIVGSQVGAATVNQVKHFISQH